MNTLKPLCYIISDNSPDILTGELLLGILNLHWMPVTTTSLETLGISSEDEALVSLNILRRCDAVFVLDGWRQKEICRIEYDYSLRNGKLRFFSLDDVVDGIEFINEKISNIAQPISSFNSDHIENQIQPEGDSGYLLFSELEDIDGIDLEF